MNNIEAIAVLQKELDGIPFDLDKSDFEQALEIAIKAIRNDPIDDLSDYSDKLWQKAYERGKAEARPQGEWEKPFLHSDGRWYHKCTNCHICSEVSILQDKYCNFCVNCGADMRVKDELPVELKYIKGGMELSLIKSNKPSLKTVELANVIADVLSDQNITIDRLKETLNLLTFIDEDSGTVVKYLRVD